MCHLSHFTSTLELTWWRHEMETFSLLLALCAGNSPVPGESPTQRPVTRSLMFSLICARIKGWVNNGEAGDLRCYHAHYDIIVMYNLQWSIFYLTSYYISLDAMVSPSTVLLIITPSTPEMHKRKVHKMLKDAQMFHNVTHKVYYAPEMIRFKESYQF